MAPRPLRFLAALSTTLLLVACGKDAEAVAPDVGEPDVGEPDALQPITLQAPADELWMEPRFSPDGSRIAFVVSRLNFDMFSYRPAVMNADGTGVQMLTTGDEGFSVDWSGDGTRVVYTAGFGRLYSVPATGGTPVLEYAEYRAEDIDVSPDGRSVLYNVETGELKLLDLATKTVQVLTEEGHSQAGTFSPDGERATYLYSPDSITYELRVLTLATKQSTLLTTDVGPQTRADWLPDGRVAAITTGGISLFDLSGATPQGRLVHADPGARELDVSNDGSKMVYSPKGRSRFYVLTGF